MPEFHSEPYIHLAGLSHDSAIIAWGAFYFRVKSKKEGDEFKLVDDDDLADVHPPRKTTIGARSEPYGKARVEVFDTAGARVASAETTATNWVRVTGLKPNTEYTYKIFVKDEEWAAGERRDWVAGPEGQGLKRMGRSYDNRFRTHPRPDQSEPLNFAVLGDFGTGVRKPSTANRRQREVAAAIERAVDKRNVRLMLTTGDNIYAGKTFLGLPIKNTGDEDDDWFFTYYQPYRYVINRVPVYPTVGNHDDDETEKSDDRDQMMDNFYLIERMSTEELIGHPSLQQGLFYRVRFGADIEFLCIDTTKAKGKRLFEHSTFAPFVESSLADASTAGPGAPVWRIPFAHHPPYCAGPNHRNTDSMLERLVPLFRRAKVRAVLTGHEHNFQHSLAEDINYLITGGGGKVTLDAPTRFNEARTLTWAAEAHFLLVEVDRERMIVTPFGGLDASDGLSAITRLTADKRPETAPIEIPLAIHAGD